MKKKLILIGSTGGLGTKLCDYLKNDYDLIGVGSKDLNICNKEEVYDYFNKKGYNLVPYMN